MAAVVHPRLGERRGMAHPICLAVATALAFGICGSVTGRADAAPVPIRAPHRAVFVAPMRAAGNGFVHAVTMPFHSLAHTIAVIPIKALPLLVVPRPVAAAHWLPSLGFVSLLAPLDSLQCTAPDRRVLVSNLSPTAFAPLACTRSARNGMTSLVPGRNKDALYGSSYTSHADDLP